MVAHHKFQAGDKVSFHIGNNDQEAHIDSMLVNDKGETVAILSWTNAKGEEKSAHRKLDHLKLVSSAG